jgi:hypothetical protein
MSSLAATAHLFELCMVLEESTTVFFESDLNVEYNKHSHSGRRENNAQFYPCQLYSLAGRAINPHARQLRPFP